MASKLCRATGVMPSLPPVDVKLFGRSYAAPIGVAPMGGPSLVWLVADLLMAKGGTAGARSFYAQRRRGATIEQAAEAAPDVFWLQLYRFWHDDHKIGFDLVRRGKRSMPRCLCSRSTFPVRTTARAKLCRPPRTNSIQCAL
jgi:L-lactate dehydrogenase (cytochrome)